MSKTSYDDSNLAKHGITKEEVKEVFASDLTFPMDLDPSDRGNNRAMLIGWTQSGRILEIGIEYFDDEDREHIFHAMDAGKQYKNAFEKRLRL